MRHPERAKPWHQGAAERWKFVRVRAFPIVLVLLFFSAVGAASSEEAFSRRTPVVVAVEKVGPAVVNIQSEVNRTRSAAPFGGMRSPFFDDFFQDFFRTFPQWNERSESVGSGFLISPDGTIFTNEHVVAGASKITVTLQDDRQFQARVVGISPALDLAVVKIDAPEDLPFASMGTSSDLLIGETVIAIGNPFGLSHTVSTGVISALGRDVQADGNRVYVDLIQIDASINPGNSGGPLLNINGEVIGMNTAIYRGAEGIGFAIPIEKAKKVVKELVEHGRVRRAWLGVWVQEMTPEMARHFALGEQRGVLVSQIHPGGPGEEAGLRRGDFLLKLDGRPVGTQQRFRELLTTYTVGERVRVSYFREGERRDIEVTSVEMPAELVQAVVREWLGVEVADLNPALAEEYRLRADQGVVITDVLPGGQAARMGLQPGDLVVQLNGREIGSKTDFERTLEETGDAPQLALMVQRGFFNYQIVVPR